MPCRSSAPAEPTPRPATTAYLLGDRVVCAFCDLTDHAVRFVAEDLPLCEDCEANGLGDRLIAAAGGGP